MDGERIQAHKQKDDIKLFSRRLLEISEQYPDVCQFIRENINAENVIVEGEVVAMDNSYKKMLPFQVLSKRRRKYDIEDIARDVPVCLFLFDLLKYEEESYIENPLVKRREKLEEIVKERKELRLVKSVKIESTEQLLDFFNEARAEGTEGIIGKSISTESSYQAGNRGFLWIKMKGIEGAKLADTIDCVIVGGLYGRGRRGGVFGTYIVAVYNPENDNFIAFSRVSSGWTDEIVEKLMGDMKQYEIPNIHPQVICDDKADQWFRPEVTIEITGDEITMSDKFSTLGYSLRFPVFLRFRPEKSPKDITTTGEIENLYDLQ